MLRVLSWNVDGLSERGINIRTKKMLEEVLAIRPDIFMIQEVSYGNGEQIVDTLHSAGYKFAMNDEAPYFCALAWNSNTIESVKCLNSPFPQTNQFRELLIGHFKFKGRNIVALTSHFESMKESAAIRKEQARVTRDIMQSLRDGKRSELCPVVPDLIIFGGDTNLRESEMKSITNVHPTLKDAWIESGSQKHTQFTWDTMKNKNLNVPFVSQIRFDQFWFDLPTNATVQQEKPSDAVIDLVSSDEEAEALVDAPKDAISRLKDSVRNSPMSKKARIEVSPSINSSSTNPKSGTGLKVAFDSFKLVGTTIIPNSCNFDPETNKMLPNLYPSDHWGIFCQFQMK